MFIHKQQAVELSFPLRREKKTKIKLKSIQVLHKNGRMDMAVLRSNFFTNPILEAPRPAVTVNVVSGSLKGRSRKDTKSDSSSKSQSHKSSTSSLSRVMTPGNVSRESGYITSTQRTEIGWNFFAFLQFLWLEIAKHVVYDFRLCLS